MSPAEFLQVDVFTDVAYRGNALAVFPDVAGMSTAQMQAIASEMNLSETTFVTGSTSDSYDVRIFTPDAEYAFAGHPTIGTAWSLLHLGLVSGDTITQYSRAGATVVARRGGRLWFERTGSAGDDVEDRSPGYARTVAAGLGISADGVGLEARELGRSGRLRPAWSDAGLPSLVVPVAGLDALGRCRVTPTLADLAGDGDPCVYCFTAVAAGRLRARGLFPASRIAEDPATGSGAAALGLYLADRIGSIDLDVDQGVEMRRPSRISVRAHPGRVEVGGSCRVVLTGRLEELPA